MNVDLNNKGAGPITLRTFVPSKVRNLTKPPSDFWARLCYEHSKVRRAFKRGDHARGAQRLELGEQVVQIGHMH